MKYPYLLEQTTDSKHIFHFLLAELTVESVSCLLSVVKSKQTVYEPL